MGRAVTAWGMSRRAAAHWRLLGEAMCRAAVPGPNTMVRGDFIVNADSALLPLGHRAKRSAVENCFAWGP